VDLLTAMLLGACGGLAGAVFHQQVGERIIEDLGDPLGSAAVVRTDEPGDC
jgi:hypothetical protein